ncbi:MAG: hypothetical protein GY768_29645 [Planctomycetaceae bacterium]|nr:hypothetical protein [Planctomycetaceae bacterium]
MPTDSLCRTGRIPANDPAFEGISVGDAALTAEKEPGYRLAMESRRDPRDMLKLQRDAKKILEYQLPSPSDLYDEMLEMVNDKEMADICAVTGQTDPKEALDRWLNHLPIADLAGCWLQLRTVERQHLGESERLQELRARLIQVVDTRILSDLDGTYLLREASADLIDAEKGYNWERDLINAAILGTRDVAAFTITGANVNFETLCQLGPRIAIVEEAAEVLEPLLVGCLPPSVEHVILLGDHQQLAPPPELKAPS